MNPLRRTALQMTLLACSILTAVTTHALQADSAGGIISFSSARWTVVNGSETELFGRACFMGSALIEDVAFGDGVIEVDIAVNGGRSYPGIIFRKQSDLDFERFYIRPHRAGLYPDALQYTPVFNRVAGWQLYSGPGFTAPVELPDHEWFHVKLEIQGAQARVFVGDGDSPDLTIPALKHGRSTGGIGLMGPADGSTCFANFTYRADANLEFPPPPEPAPTPPGTILDWEVSRVFPAQEIDRENYPGELDTAGLRWQPARGEGNGLLDIARFALRSGGAETVIARTFVDSPTRRQVKLSFGYSDEIDLFVNGRKVFAGRSAYRSRDPSFTGIVGLHDDVYLNLEAGRNEIVAMVTESFGGWALMGRLGQ